MVLCKALPDFFSVLYEHKKPSLIHVLLYAKCIIKWIVLNDGAYCELGNECFVWQEQHTV